MNRTFVRHVERELGRALNNTLRVGEAAGVLMKLEDYVKKVSQDYDSLKAFIKKGP